jgi:hypothetical protein
LIACLKNGDQGGFVFRERLAQWFRQSALGRIYDQAIVVIAFERQVDSQLRAKTH